jgi:N-acetylglucosaminyl-diphospho-decaprenol L-rhamnosyltransferase
MNVKPSEGGQRQQEVPKISFLVVNWNGSAILHRCLTGIERTCQDISHEIIVVDNGSTDDSAAMVSTQFPGVKLIRLERNHYFAYPNNLAARNAAGEHLFLLNNDVILQPGCVSQLLHSLEADTHVCAVAPQLRYPDGCVQPSCRRLPTFSNLLLSGLRLDNAFSRVSWKMADWDHATPRYVEQPMMSALLVRGKSWRSVGELDERFALYFNDVDWCRRAIDSGWTILFDPKAQAIHYEAWTGKRLGVHQSTLSARGLYRYFRKHHVKSIISWRWPVLAFLVCGLVSLGVLSNFFPSQAKTEG